MRGSWADTVTATERTSAVPSAAEPVKRTSWLPGAAFSGTRTVPVTWPLAPAVRLARRTGVDRRSTATVLPGAKPPQDTATDWPIVREVSATVQAGAAVVLEPAVVLVVSPPEVVEVVSPATVLVVELAAVLLVEAVVVVVTGAQAVVEVFPTPVVTELQGGRVVEVPPVVLVVVHGAVLLVV